MSNPGALYFTLKEERVILMKYVIRPIQGESTLSDVVIAAGYCIWYDCGAQGKTQSCAINH